MERLTEQKNNYKTLAGQARHLATINAISKYMLRDIYSTLYDKLQKIEDLEEEIGMTLDNFYKCIKHAERSIYIIKFDNDYEEYKIIRIYKDEDSAHYFSENGFIFIGTDECENYYEIPFTCYGESLYFSSEEAEEALEKMKNG